MSLRLVIISDTHSLHRQLTIPEGDVLIFSGDMCGLGLEKEIVDFNDWLGKQPCKHKIVIAGNHDYPFTKFVLGWNKRLLSNAHYLENEEIVIDGVKFYGSPMTPTFCGWWFMADRGEEIKKYWDMIPNDVAVLITHGPPYGILDETIKTDYDHMVSRYRVGCEELLKRIKQLEKMKVHCFGHIHAGYGLFKREGLQFVNASNCDECYEPTNAPIVVEI